MFKPLVSKLTGLILSIMVTHQVAVFSQNFKGGIVAGFNGSQVDGDTYAGYNKFGFMGGVFTYVSLNERSDVQLEIKYMGKGANKVTTESDPQRYTNQLNYIEIPVLYRFKTSKKFGFEGGLAFGYLFSYSIKNNYGKLANDLLPDFKHFELSWLLGLNYQWSPKFSLNTRYSYSILPILDRQANSLYFRNRGSFNNLFSIGIYYTVR